ncbi:MAG TPA: hypothetical protein VMT79_16530 [Candidatus Binatia bacterium]|nr:hypothetical protein [Candidatus Binatia bacterium]
MAHHARRSTGRPGRTFGPWHILGLFAFYAILAFAVLAFAFFFLFTIGEMALVVVLTALVAAVATIVHVRAGKRTRVDALIDRGP